jgi:hypothetical protein
MIERIIRAYGKDVYVNFDDLKNRAPSLFAQGAHSSRSSRYNFISTMTIMEAMKDAGFFPTEVRQSTSRDISQVPYAKHLVRFRQASTGDVSVGSEFPEVVLINSHNGSSRYKLLEGIFRLVCSNGLIVADLSKGSAGVSIVHSGHTAVAEIVHASLTIVRQSQERREHIEAMRQVHLNLQEQQAFIRAAASLRFSMEVINEGLIHSLNRPLRAEDNFDDLWTTFNRVQEKLVNGGTRMLTASGNRIVKAKPVKGIDGNVKLNTALWTLTQEMLRIKTA